MSYILKSFSKYCFAFIDRAAIAFVYFIVTGPHRLTRYHFLRRVARATMRVSSSGAETHLLDKLFTTYEQSYDIPNSAAAQRDLLQLCKIFPKNPLIYARLLRLAIYNHISFDITAYIYKTADKAVLNDPEINLLLLFQRIKWEQFENAAKDLQTIPIVAISNDSILLEIWRISAIHLIVKDAPSYFERFDPSSFAKLIATEYNPNVMFDILINLFHKPISTTQFYETIDLISNIKLATTYECFSVIYFYLMACGFAAHASSLEKLNSDFALHGSHPLHIKGKFCPQRIGEPARSVPRAALERASTDATEWSWRKAKLQKIEIDARLKSSAGSSAGLRPAASQPKHLLVAFFGQLRFPAFTLPKIKDWIESDFREESGSFEISYGISTWRTMGSRIVRPDDSLNDILPYFPSGLANTLKTMPLSSASACSEMFPRFTQNIFSKMSLVSDQVRTKDLEVIFGGAVHHNIGCDEVFMREIGSSISQFAPGQSQMLNQGRMIDRIGAFKQIIEQIDATKNPISHVLFIRPDLCNMSGSARKYLRRAEEPGNWAILDEDLLAQVIEGVGDRYILADRAAADHIIGARAKVQRIFTETPRNDDLCSRLSGHQMLGSVLFENAVETLVVPTAEIQWDVFRGDFCTEDALRDLRHDIDQLSDENIKQELLSNL